MYNLLNQTYNLSVFVVCVCSLNEQISGSKNLELTQYKNWSLCGEKGAIKLQQSRDLYTID